MIRTTVLALAGLTALVAPAQSLLNLTLEAPYLHAGGDGWFIPAANMINTNYYSQSGQLTYDSRPGLAMFLTQYQGYGAVSPGPEGLAQVVAPNFQLNQNMLLTYGGTAQGGFYLGRFHRSGTPPTAVQSTFNCAGGFTRTVNSVPVTFSPSEYGMGCGPAMWDQKNLKLYTMAYYSSNTNFPGATMIGSFVVLQTWCFDPIGSTCAGGQVGPVWVNNDLGIYPVSAGIQTYKILYAESNNEGGISVSGPTLLFEYTLDSIIWTSIKAVPLTQPFSPGMAGMFVTPGTVANVYTLGGVL